MVKYIFKEKYKVVLRVGKIICLAQTYKKHAKEMKSNITKDPLLFLKPSSSVIFNGDSIIIPSKSKCLHHEVELGVVIGKKCKNINQKNAMNYILGYLLALDITARDIQSEAKKNGWPWTVAKGFDTFAPISDIVLKEDIKNPNNLDLELSLNGIVKQSSNTKNMIFSVEKIIEFISQIMTLEKGDLIMTGTPEGVGEISSGDIIEAKLDNLCSLKIFVKK
jgi:2-keto-4-pentenoate hydratase/2-oxohepta-3-ene-1,7-dioic acid hydratase in catechol pathway